MTIKKNTLFFIFFSIIVALIVGNRGSTRDTFAYFSVFKNIDNYNLLNPINFYQLSGMELGYGWYSYLVSLFTDSGLILFFIWSFFIFYSIYIISKKINIKFIWVFLLYITSGYFVLQQFMQIRQGFAVPLALIGVVSLFVYDRVTIKFILFSLFSAFIHQMAIPVSFFGLIVWLFVSRSSMTLWKFKSFSVILLFLSILFSKFVLGDILMSISGRVSDYSETEYAEKLSLFRLPNIKAFLTFIMILFLMNVSLYKNKIFVAFYLLFVLGLSFRIGFIDFSILSGRFSTALTFVEIFILPFVFFRFGKIGVFYLLVFILVQAVATYGYQVPEEFYESYFIPYE